MDLGIKTFAVLSSNNQITKYASINPHKNLLTTLRKLNKSLQRKEKGSQNRKKARIELAKLHARISNVRVDYIEKTTTSIANNHSHVAVENLNLSGMVKNRKLARSILDMGFYNFRNRLATKLKERNKTFILADRWFASSKICNSCSHKHQDLTLKDRMWVCPNCNVRHDRDENAARNLEKLAVSSTVSVCGVASNGGMLVY